MSLCHGAPAKTSPHPHPLGEAHQAQDIVSFLPGTSCYPSDQKPLSPRATGWALPGARLLPSPHPFHHTELEFCCAKVPAGYMVKNK